MVWVGRYVMMPDHLHVFVSAEDSVALSRWAGSLKKYMAAKFRERGFGPPYWQKGFFDHLLRSADSYSAKWEYVRNNPVRAGLTDTAQNWPFAGEIHVLSWR